MGALDPEVAHQREAVRGLRREAERARDAVAARVARAVVAHEPVARERRLRRERREEVGAHAGVDEDDGLPGAAAHLVLELNAVDGRPRSMA